MVDMQKDIRRETKNKLLGLCQGVLLEMLEEVGFSDEERIVFYNRYVVTNPLSKTHILLLVPCGSSKYNDIHNRILDKVHSYFEHIK